MQIEKPQLIGIGESRATASEHVSYAESHAGRFFIEAVRTVALCDTRLEAGRYRADLPVDVQSEPGVEVPVAASPGLIIGRDAAIQKPAEGTSFIIEPHMAHDSDPRTDGIEAGEDA